MKHSGRQLGRSPRGTLSVKNMPQRGQSIYPSLSPSLAEVHSLLTWPKPAEQQKAWEKVRETQRQRNRH